LFAVRFVVRFVAFVVRIVAAVRWIAWRIASVSVDVGEPAARVASR
jgi:hypothetical protein